MTEREKAEQWLAEEMATKVSDHWSTMTPEDYDTENDGWDLLARIAADAIERVIDARDKAWKMVTENNLMRADEPIPWAEAIPKETP